MPAKSKKLAKTQLPVTGMTCATCAITIEKELAQLPGVKQARVNFAAEKATIEHDPARSNLAGFRNTISKLGYGIATSKSIFAVRA